MVRTAAVLAVVTVLGVYYGVSEHLPELPQWGDVAFLGLGLMPLTFLLVWLALPLREAAPRKLAVAAVSLVVLAVILEFAGLDIAANFVKIAAVAAVGWWFLGLFEALSWVLLVALLIVPVDAFSVARGPTKEIVENQPQVFNALSVSFPLRASTLRRSWASRTSSSSRSSSAPRLASACGSGGRGWR